jgi:hypothetical protein
LSGMIEIVHIHSTACKRGPRPCGRKQCRFWFDNAFIFMPRALLSRSIVAIPRLSDSTAGRSNEDEYDNGGNSGTTLGKISD